jgi:hypothetical protein
MEMKMKKFLAAFLVLGLLFSAGATIASAASASAYQQYNGFTGGNG